MPPSIALAPNGRPVGRDRTGPADDGWAAENPGWSWDEVAPFFERSMDYGWGETESYGGHRYRTGGPWHIEGQRIS